MTTGSAQTSLADFELTKAHDFLFEPHMLVIGAVAGWLAGLIYSGAGFGLVGNIIVGILGAIIAGYLLPGYLHFSGIVGQIITDAIGAVILLFLVNVVYRMAR
jgi:uncharacterized membrane protein YeaQ/YmgE (transglycosylase-associated protein family)